MHLCTGQWEAATHSGPNKLRRADSTCPPPVVPQVWLVEGIEVLTHSLRDERYKYRISFVVHSIFVTPLEGKYIIVRERLSIGTMTYITGGPVHILNIYSNLVRIGTVDDSTAVPERPQRLLPALVVTASLIPCSLQQPPSSQIATSLCQVLLQRK